MLGSTEKGKIEHIKNCFVNLKYAISKPYTSRMHLIGISLILSPGSVANALALDLLLLELFPFFGRLRQHGHGRGVTHAAGCRAPAGSSVCRNKWKIRRRVHRQLQAAQESVGKN